MGRQRGGLKNSWDCGDGMTKQEAIADWWAKEIAAFIDSDIPRWLVERHLSAGLQTAFEGIGLANEIANTGAMLRDFEVLYDVYI